MRLPDDLRLAVERELEASPAASLAPAASRLSASYTACQFAGALASPEMRAAYLATRLPATYAANFHVFSELRRVAADFAPRTLLDLGAGPGTVAWAASEVFPSIEQIECVERDASLVAIAKRLALDCGCSALRSAVWTRADLNSRIEAVPHDVVTICYTVGEFGGDAAQRLIDRAWALATGVLVIVEPGTPKAFARMTGIRNALIAAGAHLVAPCPHHNECPMAAAGDWCHFAQRVERTAVHRRLKQGALGFEDEKFSYLIASRHPLGHADARIVRHPAKNPGHVQLTLCTTDGLQKQTVGKSQRERYKAARHSDWGDPWDQ
jgi:ribosomal protein RSM22 (predicted rRNA methylase)